MKIINWHRLFGLILIHFFKNSPFEVKLEEDLSLKQQFLDVLIIRKKRKKFDQKSPDGLELMSDYNLFSYKSMQEPLNCWSIKELIGHYVNFRKQISTNGTPMIPEEKFRLFAISTRFPLKLAEEVTLWTISKGVYKLFWGNDELRLIVLSQVPKESKNTIWKLFSGIPDHVDFAAKQLRGEFPGISTVINDALEKYELEGLEMPYTLEDYHKECAKEYLRSLSYEDAMEAIINHYGVGTEINGALEKKSKEDSSEDILKNYTPEERLKGLSPEEIRKYLDKLEK